MVKTSPVSNIEPTQGAVHADVDEGAGSTTRYRRWHAFLRHRAGVVALIVLALFYLLAFLGPLVYRVSPTDTNALATNLPPVPVHVLGTDELGRDELARILSGGRISLTLSVVAVAITVGIGTLVGILAGYYRGLMELVLMRLVDAAMAIPTFFLVLIEITVFGNTAGVVTVVIGVTYWPQVARVVHSEAISLREREYVEASAALGAGRVGIMWRHILPHLIPSIVVMASLAVAWAILTESALSFLGLGIQPPEASWGSLLQNAQSYIFLDTALAIFPGLCIAGTVLAFNIIGDSLRDVL